MKKGKKKKVDIIKFNGEKGKIRGMKMQTLDRKTRDLEFYVWCYRESKIPSKRGLRVLQASVGVGRR